MFTGIVEEIGIVTGIESMGGGVRLSISAEKSAQELQINDSVSVNGVCETVVWKQGNIFKVEAVEETLKKTSLGLLLQGSYVNLELPMRLNERLGGHLVAGHVDTTGIIGNITARESSWIFNITFPEKFSKYIVYTGSITVDGVSLTIAELGTNNFSVSIIPHTMEHTIFNRYRTGSIVNIEFDLIGKYIENMIKHSPDGILIKRDLVEKELREQGF
jgi:riboflavin synthase